MVGEMAMLIDTTHTATVVALEPIKAMKFSRASVLAVMHDDPDIAAHFVGKLTARLQSLAAELRAVDDGLMGRERTAAPAAGPRADTARPRAGVLAQ